MFIPYAEKKEMMGRIPGVSEREKRGGHISQYGFVKYAKNSNDH